MSWRKQELARFSTSLSWLPEDKAQRTFARANATTSRGRYGLNESVWDIRERWDVEKIGASATRAKLASYARDEEFFLCFGSHDVCRISRIAFLDHWQDMFAPSRDDVVVMPDSEEWCLFYCHEDEFEAGRKKAPNQTSEPTRETGP
ncbi:MAG: hypothetical protein KF715_21285 [Candidatus Didemnitutus sp.]|nr:hypothetical protein [Candidatus Didemnitutus sp.]